MTRTVGRPIFSEQSSRPISRRQLAMAGLALAMLGGSPAAVADPVQTGTVRIEQVQIAFIGSGNLGGGTLNFNGQNYSFTIGGLGVGGIGISKMQAVGEVYDLHNLRDFAGTYLQARTGIAIANVGGGQLWLRNANGVYLRLQTERQGLALSLGGDAIYIDFD